MCGTRCSTLLPFIVALTVWVLAMTMSWTDRDAVWSWQPRKPRSLDPTPLWEGALWGVMPAHGQTCPWLIFSMIFTRGQERCILWLPVYYSCEVPACISQDTTHMFNGPSSWTTMVSQYQKGKTSLDFNEARDSEWQWHQLGHMEHLAPHR